MLKCDSCSKTFLRVGDLFEHIQSACLVYYKSHPQAWSKILSKLGNEDNDEPKAAMPSTSRNVEKEKSGTSKPTTSAKTEVPGTSARTPNNKEMPFVCKCEVQFKKLEYFKAHLKVCTPGKEPPFCIMFRAQDADSGKPLRNVHMTVNDYFYGLLTGKQVKLKKINRRCNCYSCGKNLKNNIRFMSHVRHKIINEWEKKEDVDARNICQHCYRQYNSPFLLQCHLENVHGSVPAACSCRICELHFPSERAFLFHMKDKHVHNEAPYVCKVCNYHSSFYNDVIKHFRDEHTDTSALMCPFCLAVSFNSSSFLRHVLQHIKKGSECQRCRLMFPSSKEKTVHQQVDHTSQVIAEKARKYKNLQKCQIYVRVASFQMTKRQHMMQRSPEQFSLENGSVTGSKRAPEDTGSSDDTKQGPSPRKKPFITPAIELPPYLCPLKKPQRMKRVRMPGKRRYPMSSLRCVECGDVLQNDSFGIMKHFQNVHECRWCVFVTSCEKAAHNHVLKEHADTELREQLVGKSESDNAGFTAELDNDDEEDLSMKFKEEPELPPLPINILSPQQPRPLEQEENLSGTDQSKQANGSSQTDSSTQSKARRKQSNPMRVYGQYFENSPSPKKIRREKKVQARGFEAEKGTQASDKDFGGYVPDVEFVDDIPSPDNKKSILKVSNKPPRNRKILAPEGYFPDIDDDEGWAKYFAEVEGTTWPGSDKKNSASGTQTSDGLVPTTATTPMMPNKGTEHDLAGKPALAGNGLLATSSGVAPTGMLVTSSGVTPSSTFVGTVQTKLQPSNSNISEKKKISPTMVTTSGPVFRFQVVPANTVPPSKFNSSSAALRPVMRNKTPIPGLMNRVQRMLSHVPQSPVNLRCLEFTHSTMLIQWDAPINCAVSQYKVIFQGSGAPTVQLLPPEQTLVRLVGLKSDTMYVVRVYTMCNKAISQYTFLYQRTRKMIRHAPRSGDDIVLVVDDDPTSAPITTASVVRPNSDVVPLPPTTSTYLVQQSTSTPTDITLSAVPLPQVEGVASDMTKLDSDKVVQSSNAVSQSDGAVVVKPPGDLKQDVQTYLNKEKSEKKTLINELLACLKKNKNQKAKTGKIAGAAISGSSACASGDSDGNMASTPKIDIVVSGSSSDAPAESDEGNVKDDGVLVNDEDDVFMVIDSPGSSNTNSAARVKSSGVKNDKLESSRKDSDSLVSDVSVDATQVCSVGDSSMTTITPVLVKSQQDKLTYVTILQPPSLQRQASSGSETNDVGIQITSVKSGSTPQEQPDQLNLSDKENIPVETDELRQSQNTEMEVNIVNVVSLRTPPREKITEQSDRSIESNNGSIVTEAVFDGGEPKSDALKFDAVQVLSDAQQSKAEAGIDGTNDCIIVLDDDVLRQTDVKQGSTDGSDAVTITITDDDKAAILDDDVITQTDVKLGSIDASDAVTITITDDDKAAILDDDVITQTDVKLGSIDASDAVTLTITDDDKAAILDDDIITQTDVKLGSIDASDAVTVTITDDDKAVILDDDVITQMDVKLGYIDASDAVTVTITGDDKAAILDDDVITQTDVKLGFTDASDAVTVTITDDDVISQTDVNLGFTEASDAVTATITGDDKAAVCVDENLDDVAQGAGESLESKCLIAVPESLASGELQPSETLVDRSTKAPDQADRNSENVDSVVIVLDQDTNKEEMESRMSITAAAAKDGESATDQTEESLVCEISIGEPIQSSEISQTVDSDSTAMSGKPTSLMPRPLQMVALSSSSRTVIDNTVLDEKTGAVTEQSTESNPKEGKMMVFINNDEMADDTKEPSGEEVDAAITEEIKILGGGKIPSESDVACGSGPTLDDIKDIMDCDLSWL